MSQILRLITLIAEGINAICHKIKRGNAQDRSNSVDSNPADEFIDTFGMCKAERDNSAPDTGEHSEK